MEELLLETKGLCKYFSGGNGGLFGGKEKVLKAVDNVDLEVKQGETLAVVGESGSGKTTLGKTMIRILKPTKGSIWFNGEEISTIDGTQLRRYRRNMQMVFQDPTSSLNPRKTVLDIISLAMKIHLGISRAQRRERVTKLLDDVDLSEEFMHRYPHALSGGQKQRVGIARALALGPKLIVLDEPTSALDVSVQAKMLSLLEQIRNQYTLTYIYISHDLSVVRNIAERTVVMYLGKVMEMAPTEELFGNPLHPYTKALLSAIPIIAEAEKNLIPEEITLEGEVPSPANVPFGCAFSTRCSEKMGVCEAERPSLIEFEKDHFVSCHHYSNV